MAEFKKAPVPEAAPPPEPSGFLDPELAAQITQAAATYWPLALGLAAMLALLLKGYRGLAPVAAFAALVVQGILLEWFW